MWTNNSRILNGYTIADELGSGAFGKVYSARKDGQRFAMKKIDIGRRDNAERIMKEVTSHLRLSHENVVKYHNNFSAENAVWIVIEYCNGGSLNAYLQNYSPGYGTLLDFTQQVARGVDYLHSQEVIHRDLKPDNIMLCQGWFSTTLKIADFGLARVWDNFSYQSPYYDFQYDPRGPPYYSAPEIRQGNVTIKSDIFSLGCMVLAIFSRTCVIWIGGRLLFAPFIGTARLQIADATEDQKRNYIREYVKLTCNGADQVKLQNLVFRMVQDNWRDRPNARSMLREIEKLTNGCVIL